MKDVLRGADWEEKCDQLRLYSGAKFTAVPAAESGSVVAVVGLTMTRAGEGLGAARDAEPPSLQPVLEYELRLPEGTDAQQAYGRLRVLEEEDPQLHLRWDARTRQIRVQLMGQVQQTAAEKGEHIALLQARKHAAWYMSGLRGAAALRRQAGELKTLEDLAALCLAVIRAEEGTEEV